MHWRGGGVTNQKWVSGFILEFIEISPDYVFHTVRPSTIKLGSADGSWSIYMHYVHVVPDRRMLMDLGVYICIKYMWFRTGGSCTLAVHVLCYQYLYLCCFLF